MSSTATAGSHPRSASSRHWFTGAGALFFLAAASAEAAWTIDLSEVTSGSSTIEVSAGGSWVATSDYTNGFIFFDNVGDPFGSFFGSFTELHPSGLVLRNETQDLTWTQFFFSIISEGTENDDFYFVRGNSEALFTWNTGDVLTLSGSGPHNTGISGVFGHPSGIHDGYVRLLESTVAGAELVLSTGGTSVPEPSTITLAGTALVALLRRRRRG